MMRRLLSAAAIGVVTLLVLGAPCPAAHAADINLTGIWSCDDGGTYYVRQVGGIVWWLGKSEDDGRSWTNVFKGTIRGDIVSGAWGDVPQGSIMGSGALTLKLHFQDGRVVGMEKVRQVGDGFGGARWNRQ
jgi:hypothetical protein